MLEPRIQQQFFESADLLYQSAEALSRPLAAAAQLLVDGITAGGRVLCCGFGPAQLDARYLAALLVGRFEQERPGLGALALDALTDAARQIQTLGHPGDLLVVFDAQGAPAADWAAVLDAAHEQDMNVIALGGGAGESWRAHLHDTDLALRIASTRPARVAEGLRLLTHCLCDAVDMQLLGDTE
ncbi:MAG: SIS domain-containing protein [Pelomonas sp.]|nr:SIS domain-containing protein [Roseateles sp.]